AVCVGRLACRMRGIGEQLTPLAEQHMPRLDLVLVNPGVPVATPTVFQSLEDPHQSTLPALPDQHDFQSWLNWLDGTRNDLYEPACRICPQIGDVISELSGTGAQLSRMSGSGASCFGIFGTPAGAHSAATALKKLHPDWWICATHTV
ncbi:MAG: 4-(cytidine 5'-diphospho)-2-C-methyl-D-erythritol kinase, partial [Hyphomicrobiales bacterium]